MCLNTHCFFLPEFSCQQSNLSCLIILRVGQERKEGGREEGRGRIWEEGGEGGREDEGGYKRKKEKEWLPD